MRQEQSKALKESKSRAVAATATKKEELSIATTAPVRQTSAKKQKMTEEKKLEMAVDTPLQLKTNGDAGILKVILRYSAGG